MSKSVIVIDTPNDCDNCDFCYWSDGRFRTCGITHMGISKQNMEHIEKSKPDWCPLVPLPEKLEGNNSIYYQWGDYEDGWNHCIDAILGEQNE